MSRRSLTAALMLTALVGPAAAQTTDPARRAATRPPLQLHDESPVATPVPAPGPAPAPTPAPGPAETPAVAPEAVPPPAAAVHDAVARDPVAVVRAFYDALGRADGIAANAYLVPAKRGQGPFDPQAIAAFYGAMAEPLRVLATGRLDPRIVRVRYAWTHRSGRRCDGAADVILTPQDGRLLIERIHSLGGC
ncbi:hypothetical protein [Azospirillum sp. ST 5-10]|uniref:hypothetical protein n=1 Tax=unclassified Azospirillum TaxID=2630922 RepID=UPI003F49CCE3